MNNIIRHPHFVIQNLFHDNERRLAILERSRRTVKQVQDDE